MVTFLFLIIGSLVSKNSWDTITPFFAVRNIVTYFNERGSNVFMASLDASKASDRVDHFRLYTALMKKMYRLLFLK